MMSAAIPILVLLLSVLVSTAAHGQSDSERTFRKWADEKILVLKENRNAGEREKAAEYLGGFEYPDVAAALGAALADPDPRVRAAAAAALWKNGKASEAARAGLMKALDDPAAAVVVRAAGALQALGMPPAELVAARQRVFAAPGISNTDRYLAARGLIGFAPPLSLLPPIVEFLERASEPRPSGPGSIAERETLEVAVGAIERLAKTGDRSLIAPLIDAARAARYSQVPLMNALALFTPKPDSWTLLLVGFLDSPNPKVRYAALALLSKETKEKDVLLWAPRTALLTRDPDELVRSEALWSLGRAGGLAASEVDSVAVVLGDPDPAMRKRAAATIGEMGDKTQAIPAAAKRRIAESARARLVALADQDPDADVRSEAKSALAKLGGEGVPGSAAVDQGGATRTANPSAEVGAVAALRERKVTMDSGSYFQALAATDVALVRAFLDAGMSSTALVAGSGPPLVVALQVGDSCAPNTRPTKADTKAVLKLLLERGADANGTGADGFTPLMAAAMKGCDREVMKMLIAAGARVGATNSAGLAAFDMGIYIGHDGLEELIAAGYRLPPEKAKAYEKAFAEKPATLALVRKATRK